VYNQSQSTRQSYQPSSTYKPAQQWSQATPSPRLDSDFQDQMLQFMSNMEQTMKSQGQTMTSLAQTMTSLNQTMNSHSQAIAKLEVQMRQMANTINKREEGTLPSQPVANPKGHYMVEGGTSHHQQVLAITTLQSGRRAGNHVQENEYKQLATPQNLQKKKSKQEKTKASSSFAPTPEMPYEPQAPFSKRLKAPSHFGKEGEKIQDMMEVFKQVKINLPLLDAIKQVPAYAKFLKNLCTQKRRTRANTPKKVFLTKQVSSILQHSLPPKFKDPRAPIISCIIGDHKIDKALLDLGAEVNLLPYSVYLQLGLGELKPTPIILQLADQSIKKLRGIIEDVIIQVDNFYFPVDFIVLDTELVANPTKMIPVILGHPFLSYN
jgi:uncharacterized coiled-coil protein SlyX